MNTVIVTCEHGGHRVPREYRALFVGRDALLRSHRGWDAGSSVAARVLARRAEAPLYCGTMSRLLVDLNRSEHHRRLFSEMTRELPRDEREAILERWYRPFRAEVKACIRAAPARHTVAHVSVHSFVPLLNGEVRNADVGLLYDPSRERALADTLVAALRDAMPRLRVRRNYPYRGVADGHTTALRRVFSARRYQGVELELSQALSDTVKGRVARVIGAALREPERARC